MGLATLYLGSFGAAGVGGPEAAQRSRSVLSAGLPTFRKFCEGVARTQPRRYAAWDSDMLAPFPREIS